MVTLTVANEKSVKVGRLSGPRWKVEAAVLRKIATKLPTSPVSFDRNWRHLSGLRLIDPEFGVPGNIDVLLGVDMFSRVVRQGRRQGPPGTPVAIRTYFGWVLSGTISYKDRQRREVSCVTSLPGSGEELWKIGETRDMTVRRFHS